MELDKDGKPITASTAAGTPDERLKKFVGADGKVDVEKLSQSYLETERMAHEATSKRAEAERAYAVLAEQLGDKSHGMAGVDGVAGRDGEDGERVTTAEKPLTRADAQPVVQGMLELIHPEVAFDPATNVPKNQKFWDGLVGYVKTLPLSVKQAIAAGDFQAQDWAIKQYKAFSGATQKTGTATGSASQGERPNFIEGASPSVDGGKKQWTKAEIDNLIQHNPKEYARIADTDIADAYKEGRVK